MISKEPSAVVYLAVDDEPRLSFVMRLDFFHRDLAVDAWLDHAGILFLLCSLFFDSDDWGSRGGGNSGVDFGLVGLLEYGPEVALAGLLESLFESK